MPIYHVTEPTKVQGKSRKPGDKVNLSAEVAEPYVVDGVITPADGKAETKKDESK